MLEKVEGLMKVADQADTPKARLQVASLATDLLAELEDAQDVSPEVFANLDPRFRVAALQFICSVFLSQASS